LNATIGEAFLSPSSAHLWQRFAILWVYNARRWLSRMICELNFYNLPNANTHSAAIGRSSFNPPLCGVRLTAIAIHFNGLSRSDRTERGQTNFNNDSILIRARLSALRQRPLNGNRMQSAKRSISGTFASISGLRQSLLTYQRVAIMAKWGPLFPRLRGWGTAWWGSEMRAADVTPKSRGLLTWNQSASIAWIKWCNILTRMPIRKKKKKSSGSWIYKNLSSRSLNTKLVIFGFFTIF